MLLRWLAEKRFRARVRSLNAAAELSRLRCQLNQLGTPRGLIWTSLRAVGPAVWIKDLSGPEGESPVALQQVEVEFAADTSDAVPDEDDMTDAPGLATTRAGTVTFRVYNGDWRADERVLFNLSPDDVIGRWPGRVERFTEEQ